jgi:hypothetical protein
MPDLEILWNWLAQPTNLIIGFNIALGYFVKRMPWIDNRFVETIVLGVSIVVTPFFKQPPIYGLMYGVIYALIAFKMYDWVFKVIEDKLKPVEPPTVIIPVFAAMLLLSGCATGPSGEPGKVDPTTIQSGAQLTSYGFTYWALNLSHGDQKDLAEKKEILAEVRKYLVIARDQGQAGASVALGLAQTLPDKEHWREYQNALKNVLAALSGVELRAALNGLISGIDQAVGSF